MICGTCIKKTSVSENTNTIWGFNPFQYSTYYDMKEAFYLFYKNCGESECSFYTSFNEEGYNYCQWYVYYLGSNTYKNKKLHYHIVWLFNILSEYPFFKNFIRLGCKEDPSSTSLLHFVKYANNITYLQKKMIELFISYDLSLDDEDGDGCSGHDYLSQKIMTKEDKGKCSYLTKIYKIKEKELDLIVYHLIGNNMKKCELCNDLIEKHKDMVVNKETLKKNDRVVEMIKEIIKTRQECISVYRMYNNSNRSLERHQYVVDSYCDIIS
jgi:hypothetical protein